MGWTQPVCDSCWALNHGERHPHPIAVDIRSDETCCQCGTLTRSGLIRGLRRDGSSRNPKSPPGEER